MLCPLLGMLPQSSSTVSSQGTAKPWHQQQTHPSSSLGLVFWCRTNSISIRVNF